MDPRDSVDSICFDKESTNGSISHESLKALLSEEVLASGNEDVDNVIRKTCISLFRSLLYYNNFFKVLSC